MFDRLKSGFVCPYILTRPLRFARVPRRLDCDRGQRQGRADEAHGVQVADEILRDTGLYPFGHRRLGRVHKDRLLRTVREKRADEPSCVSHHLSRTALVFNIVHSLTHVLTRNSSATLNSYTERNTTTHTFIHYQYMLCIYICAQIFISERDNIHYNIMNVLNV